MKVETKGRSLEELDVIFAAGGNPVEAERVTPYGISISEARETLQLDSTDHGSYSEKKIQAEKIEDA